MIKKFCFIITLGCIFFIMPILTVSAARNDSLTIAMATDNNYILPTIVTITSALENSDITDFYDYYILLSGTVSESNIEKVMSLEKKYKNCKINLVDMKNSFSENRVDGHLTTAMYYRLRLPSILHNKNKCLYMDGDIIVNKNLKELYNINVDNYYVAGVKDAGVQRKGQDHANFLGIPTIDHYINSGVLLMNLDKMRKDNIEKKFNDFMPVINNAGARQVHHDQDIINAVCFGKILILPFKFNLQVALRNLNYDEYMSNNKRNAIFKNCYTFDEWTEGCENPVLIHFVSEKPWKKGKKIKFFSKWMDYAKNTNFFDEIKDVYNLVRVVNFRERLKHE